MSIVHRLSSFTRRSCERVFCPPWERCLEGQCLCKLPYQCPVDNVAAVCGRDNRSYRSFCQVIAGSAFPGSGWGDGCQGNHVVSYQSASYRQPGCSSQLLLDFLSSS